MSLSAERFAAPGGGLAGWLDSQFADHGLLRSLYPNLHAVDDRLLRSAQPSPTLLRRLAGQGVATVINLRGARQCGSYFRARDACAALGLAMVDLPLESRGAPQRDRIARADAVLAEALPRGRVLVHCKSGADRAGLMAALYLLLHTDAPVAAAQAQLSLRYLHISAGPTGILDAFLDQFAAAQAASGIGFRAWLRDQYDEADLRARFRPRPIAGFLVDRVLGRE